MAGARSGKVTETAENLQHECFRSGENPATEMLRKRRTCSKKTPETLKNLQQECFENAGKPAVEKLREHWKTCGEKAWEWQLQQIPEDNIAHYIDI